jgi:hypothetical protein
MSKPRIVEVKKPPAKPKIVSEKEPEKQREIEEEDFSLILQVSKGSGDASQELRKQQLRDIMPSQPKPVEPLQVVCDDVRKKIYDDRKKRRGLGGDVKDLLGVR